MDVQKIMPVHLYGATVSACNNMLQCEDVGGGKTFVGSVSTNL